MLDFDDAREMLHDLKRTRCGDDGEYCHQDGCPICGPCPTCRGDGALPLVEELEPGVVVGGDMPCPDCGGSGEKTTWRAEGWK